VHYLGHNDYMISSAGYKIAPVEVEQVLSRHPAVREVAVVPGLCLIRQEIVVAYIALNSTAILSDELKRELTDLVKAELSSYKTQRRIEFIRIAAARFGRQGADQAGQAVGERKRLHLIYR
jgi:2-aminobenzoate-CoA ligase